MGILTGSIENWVVVVVGALAGSVVFLFKYVLDQHKSQMADMKAERDESRRMLFDLLHVGEEIVNRKRSADGRETLQFVPPVKALHNSPITGRQQQDADMYTIRARVATVAHELDVELPNGDPEY